MESIKEIRLRIKSIKKTQQITKTMQMVSASRLKKSDTMLKKVRPYYDAMLGFLNNLLSDSKSFASPLLEDREEKQRTVIVVTSDRGLCGAFNTNMIARAEKFLSDFNKEDVKLVCFGRKGKEYFSSRGYTVEKSYNTEIYPAEHEVIQEIADMTVEKFLSKKTDAVYIVYSRFISAMKNEPTISKLLNLTIDDIGSEENNSEVKEVDYIFEPGKSEILNGFLPRFLKLKIYQAITETVTSENSSRMLAMKAATDNASELVNELTLKANKARQAVITNEILEIVTAGEALKA